MTKVRVKLTRNLGHDWPEQLEQDKEYDIEEGFAAKLMARGLAEPVGEDRFAKAVRKAKEE